MRITALYQVCNNKSCELFRFEYNSALGKKTRHTLDTVTMQDVRDMNEEYVHICISKRCNCFILLLLPIMNEKNLE